MPSARDTARIAGEEIAAVEIDLKRPAAPERHLEQERADLERILFEQPLHEERGRSAELPEILTDLGTDGVVGQLARQFVKLFRRQEQDLIPAEELEERTGRVDSVLDEFDRGESAQLFGEQIGEVLQLLESLSGLSLDENKHVVEATEILQCFLERIDRAVALGDEVHDVPVEVQAAAEKQRSGDQQQRHEEDDTVASPGEILDAQEEALLDAPGHSMSRRPSSALPTVKMSAYSSSLPTGSPSPIRVTRTPSGFIRRDR